MKKYVIILFVTVISFGCAAVYNPAGNWDYVVLGTPNGDVNGTLVLNETDGAYSGKFISDQGELVLENVNYSEEKQLTCTFWVQGMEFSMTGTFEGDTYIGIVDGGDQVGSWPITANRVIDQ